MESSIEFSTSPTTNSQPTRYRFFKIVVIGDSGVGKTCLAYRFCAGRFPNKTEATIGVDFRERIIDIEGEKIKVCLLNYVLIISVWPSHCAVTRYFFANNLGYSLVYLDNVE